MKLITPNGEVKLIIMYRSNVQCKIERSKWDFAEQSFAVVGQTTKPAIIDPQGNFGTIGVEFKPFGVYRFFDIPLHELTDQFFHGNDVLGKAGTELHKRIVQAESLDDKITILESFLLDQLAKSKRETTFVDYAVNLLTAKSGVLNISELITDTGYSKRHFDRKFKESIGVSPKELASIIRFQAIFNRMMIDIDHIKDYMYDYYYDQSHFIKEFKRFTGLTPMEYFKQDNNFARVFMEG